MGEGFREQWSWAGETSRPARGRNPRVRNRRRWFFSGMTLPVAGESPGLKDLGEGVRDALKKKKAGIFDFDNYVFVKIVERAQITVG